MEGITDLQYKELQQSVRHLKRTLSKRAISGTRPINLKAELSVDHESDNDGTESQPNMAAEKRGIIRDLFKVDKKDFDQESEEKLHLLFDNKFGSMKVESQSERAKAYRLVRNIVSIFVQTCVTMFMCSLLSSNFLRVSSVCPCMLEFQITCFKFVVVVCLFHSMMIVVQFLIVLIFLLLI